MREKVLKAFWHKSRKVFVSWTVRELCVRTSMTHREMVNELSSLNHQDLVKSDLRHAVDVSAWQLTPAGIKEAATILQAELLANSTPTENLPKPDKPKRRILTLAGMGKKQEG